MPTTGMQVHSDYCHYPFTNGYEKFGLRIINPVLSDIYGMSFQEDINAPMISSISLSNQNLNAVEFFGKFQQGSFILGKTKPNSKVGSNFT